MIGRITRFAGELDRTLRGETSTRAVLEGGAGSNRIRRLVIGSLVLGGFYGLCMGFFALLRAQEGSVLQLVATTLKVPLLFLLTLLVTFPSLYVFSALAGSRLGAVATLRLVLVAITVNLAVLSSFGPVTAFFAACTRSYPFIKLLNVLLFAIAGGLSLAFLRRTLRRLMAPPARRTADSDASGASGAAEAAEAAPAGAGERAGDPRTDPGRTPAREPAPRTDPGRRLLTVWSLMYGVVGAQMGWVLRPFIGSPQLPFEWFRARESHVFADLLRALGDLVS